MQTFSDKLQDFISWISEQPTFPMKKILVMGDIHANFPALKAIQNRVREEKFHRIINTGDFTVYGTFPNEVVQRNNFV